jgi:phosphatidylglycerophosphate synthase
MALAGAAFAAARWDRRALWLVVMRLALNWFGDSLDGTLARVRRTERPRYGFYIDHVLDIAGATLLFGGLACSPFMTPLVALALLVAYLLVAGEVFLATRCAVCSACRSEASGPTELRIILAAGAVALLNDPPRLDRARNGPVVRLWRRSCRSGIDWGFCPVGGEKRHCACGRRTAVVPFFS